MKIYVMRHGETDANRQRLFQGSIDYPLNDFGRELAILTGQSMKDIHFDVCYSSPLKRARETAEIVLKESNNTDCPILLDDRLKEINAGIYEGKNIHLIEDENEKKRIVEFFNHPSDQTIFEGGESIGSVKKRTQNFLKELITNKDETVLVSSHGCAYRSMLNFLYENPKDFWQGHPPFNCAVTILETNGKEINILESDKLYYDPNLAKNFYNVK